MESPPSTNSEDDDNSIESIDDSEEERSIVPLDELYMRVENVVRSVIPQLDSTEVSVSCDELLLEQPLISSESVTRDREVTPHLEIGSDCIPKPFGLPSSMLSDSLDSTPISVSCNELLLEQPLSSSESVSRDREVTPHLEIGFENGSACIQEGSSLLSDSCYAVLEKNNDTFILGSDRRMEWSFTASSFSDPTPDFPSMVNSLECNNDEPHSAKRSLNFASDTDDEISDCGPGPITFLLPMSSVSSPAHAASDVDDPDFVMDSDGISESENINGRNEYTPCTSFATSTSSNLVNETNHTKRKLVDYDETSSCSDCAEGTLDDHPILSVPPSSSKRTRSVIAKPKHWTRNEAKMKRCTGQDYVGYRRKNKKSSKIIIQDTPRGGRKVGPCCQCRVVKTRSCYAVDEASRKRLFDEFWGKMDWGQKKMFLCSLVEIREVKQRTTSTSPKRSISYFYNLTVDDEKLPVCQKMFCNTFGIHRNTLRFWLTSYRNISKRQETNNCDRSASYAEQVSEDEDASTSVHDNSPSGNPSSSDCSTFKERNSFLEKFLSDIPKLPSHYCRKSSDRLYLQTDINSMAQLFELYKLKCQEVAIKPMSRFVFDNKCKVNKLSIYTPRKDRCDTCIQFEINKTLSKEAFDAHKAMKDMARAEKENDKALAKQGLIHVICCDVMKVTLLPITDASSSYYKMKLAMHNFTVYNLANHEAVCYWFCETEANLVASTFSSCLVSFLKDLLETGLKDITIYSDGCPYQNRNSVMSNALLHLSMEKNITINQKYLEKGHTQMEGDSVHSAIEHVLNNKTKVYLPYELLQITERARKEPPYKAKLLSYDFFRNYATNFIYDSIRPGNKPNDPVVNDIRHIQYDPKGTIKYRLNFKTPLQELPRRPKKPSSHSFKELYTNRLPITKDKYEDLKSMKKCIPDEAFLYYNALPHVEESYRKKKAQLKSSTAKRES